MLSALFRTSSPGADDLEERGGWEWFASAPPTWSGMPVTQANSTQLLTVYGCTRLIADGIATLPIDVFRKKANGDVEQVETPYWLGQPTTELDSIEWRTQMLTSLLLAGNAYAIVTRNTKNEPLEIVPVDPEKVLVRRNSERTRRIYVVNGKELSPSTELIHLRGMMRAGADLGMSPVEAARQSIGLGMAAVKFGAEFFDNEGNMPGVIEIPGPVQGDVMRRIARQWQDRRKGGGRGMPGVLPNGASWKMTGVTSEQAEFLSTRKFTAGEIAAQMFLVDPSDLGIPVEGSSLTYANLESRNIRRVQVTFLPWIVRLEAALSALTPRGQYVKLNVNGLLRGDTATRWSTYKTAEDINTSAAARGDKPVLSTEEMRDFEDLGPSPETPEPPESPAPPPMPETTPADEAARWVAQLAEIRSLEQRQPPINISVPERAVTVNMPESRLDAYVTNLVEPGAAPHVTVLNQVEPTPVSITNEVPQVAPPEVRVETPAITVDASRPLTRHTVKRDKDGNIVEVVESEQ